MKWFPLLTLLVCTVWVVGCSSSDDGGPAAPRVDAPSGLTATVTIDGVRLDWVDNSFNEAGFRIQRTEGSSTEWTSIDEVESDEESYTDTNTTEGQSYQYRVKSFLLSGESGPTNTVAVSIAPDGPADLTAEQDGENLDQINLTWTDASSVETGFEIERKLGGRNAVYELAAEVGNDVTEYQDTGLDLRTTYVYRVRAMQNDVESGWSDEASAMTTVYTPNPPVGLVADSSTNDPGNIRLRWIVMSFDEDGFVIERSTSSGGGWAPVDTVLPQTELFDDVGLITETTYYYRVYAYNSFGNSEYTNVASTTTPPGPPIAPSNLVGESDTYSEIILTWDDNSTDELAFRLQKHGSRTRIWDDLATLEANTPLYIDTDVLANTTYSYRVNAYKVVAGDTLRSTWATDIEVTTPEGPPMTPTDLTVEATGLHQIRVTWTREGNPETILVWRKIEGEEQWSQAAALEGYYVSFTQANVNIDTWYAYRVQAINDIGESDFSNSDSARTLVLMLPPTFEDGFENDTILAPPSGPAWSDTATGEAWVRVTDINPHEGAQSVHFNDSTPADFIRLTLALDPQQSGVYSSWLYIPNNSYFGVWGVDGSANGYLTYALQFNADGRYFYISPQGWQQGPNYPIGQWFKLMIVFDIDSQSYSVSINNQVSLEQGTLQRADHPDNSRMIYQCYSNQTFADGFMDEVMMFEINENAPGAMPTPGPEVNYNGTLRADDVQFPVIMEAGQR